MIFILYLKYFVALEKEYLFIFVCLNTSFVSVNEQSFVFTTISCLDEDSNKLLDELMNKEDFLYQLVHLSNYIFIAKAITKLKLLNQRLQSSLI